MTDIRATLNKIAPAVEQLARHQQQADADGVMVTVSRQAVDEVVSAINEIAISLSAAPGEPCAYRYRWKIDGEWTSWHVSDASQKPEYFTSLEEQPLFTTPQSAAGWDDAIEAAAKVARLKYAGSNLHSIGNNISDDILAIRREAPAPAEGVTVAAVGKHADQLILAFTAGVEHMRQAAINIAKPWEGAEGFPKVKSDAIDECRRKIVAAIESAEVRP